MKTKKIVHILAVGTVLVSLLSGCIKTEADDGQVVGIPVTVACHLQVSALEGEQSTRSGDALLNGEWTLEEENKVRDLAVFQFDGTEDEASLVILRTFQSPDLKTLKIGLLQPLDNKERVQTLYFIANSGGIFDTFSGNLGELKASQFTLSEADLREGNMVMTGSCISVIKTEIPVSATLTRRLAKLIFTIDTSELPEGSDFNVVWLQLRSVPTVCRPEVSAPGEKYPEANSNLYINSEPVLDQAEKGYVWYILENRRGTGGGTTEADKNNHTPDEYCTRIYMETDYYPKKEDKTGAKKMYYTLYPGKDIISDFNLEGNRCYHVKVTPTITGIEQAQQDARLTITDLPEQLPGANCYMTPPASTLTFNPYAAPGADITATSWTYASRLGTKDASKIDHIGLVWQTEIGLIKELYNMTGSGEIRLVTDNKAGNALIAAYNKENEILWSWHIWVTDYVLGNVNDNMADGGASTSAGGHVYKWDGYIWMDRGIGAKSATPGIESYGMIYQWGRKDPFTSGNTMAGGMYGQNDAYPIYDANGNPLYPSGQKYAESGYIFDKVMNNPTVFFFSISNTTWYGIPVNQPLWEYPEKTSFDPCPAGWGIPPMAAITNIKTGDKTTLVYQTNASRAGNRVYANGMEGLFWPYLGYRSQENGFAAGTGWSGIYWTSSYNATNQPRIYGGFMNTYNSSAGTSVARNPRDGLGGRCVKLPSSTN